ncbi:MAG: aminomethyl-transferring glycine dehydrogenase subunit GcvPA [Zetaproteobacteria bacterium]|nr:aminomethyl-transferring glycine dehydrogenase subunit GcvPA [Zetaproteobacteria bacterium]
MRFLPHTESDRQAMLTRIGATQMSDLFEDIPEQLRISPQSLDLPGALSEAAIVRKFTQAAERNRHALNTRCFLGGGTYHHFIPSVVDYIISRGEFLTAYTPYQPEISQGTLQTLFEFQTMVARLTGMEVSNASMYDAATSVAEAALMAKRVTRKNRVILANGVHPKYCEVTTNYLSHLEGSCVRLPQSGYATDLAQTIAAIDENTACVIVQYPDFYGTVYDLAQLRIACDTHKCLMVVAFADVSAFALIDPPGHYGADIAVGSGQALGIPMGFGGPHLGLFTCKQKYLRQMPGRVCGLTHDVNGQRGFVLTLSTREQHIRREKATSNICSNQGLMCTAAATYLTLMGDAGLETVAKHSAAALQSLIDQLPSHVTAASGPHYNETVITFSDQHTRDQFLSRAHAANIFAGIALETIDSSAERAEASLLIATTEMIEPDDISALVQLLEACQ